ncbi:Lrp/AsnC family transcriptional regulator [Candidatus Woesearchaeota archaeon]|nr:Lrp/AsnC family transcriptional regulator [Candidatus Woesearchaeota archaeon]
MKFTRNEKKVLKLLLDNSRITDSQISCKLGISSQAVGKIRKKMESSVIDSYSVNLNYSKLGIHTFAMAIAKMTTEGMVKGVLDVERELLGNPHVINVYRVPKGSSTHLILYGFKDMIELDEFFYSPSIKKKVHNLIETKDLFTFSHNSLLKCNPNQLFGKVIDAVGPASECLRRIK